MSVVAGGADRTDTGDEVVDSSNPEGQDGNQQEGTPDQVDESSNTPGDGPDEPDEISEPAGFTSLTLLVAALLALFAAGYLGAGVFTRRFRD